MPSLKASEERWRLTLDHAPVGIALIGLDGSIQRVNRALCETLGHSAESLMGRSVRELTHPEDHELDGQRFRRLVAGELASYQLRKRYLHALGHVVWAELSIALVRDSDGEPTHAVAHIRDLTGELAAEADLERMHVTLHQQSSQLEQTDADLDAFTLMMSHDLQAPLTTVLGYLQVLESEYADRLDDRGREWIQRVSGAATRMSELVDSMLSISPSEAPGKRRQVSLAELVEAVCDDLRPIILEHDAVITSAGCAATIEADPTRLRQVLQNLVQNALKYRHPERPPRVHIEVEPVRRAWLVTVDDNAIGIPPERRDAVFDLFTRLHARDSTAERGLGIGLAACRRIVQQLGGSIWVEDNPSGAGSRFAFTIPY